MVFREHGREFHPQRTNARQVIVPARRDFQLRADGAAAQP